MRELTEEELLLVAGGNFLCSEPDEPWWQSAFSWLETSLGALGNLLPGGLGQYIGGFGNVAGSMTPTGNMIWDRAHGYNNYVINQQSLGGSILTFEQWHQACYPPGP